MGKKTCFVHKGKTFDPKCCGCAGASAWRIHEAAVDLGRLGGLAKSAKKTKAVRENGKKGGRPKDVNRVKSR